MSFLSASSLSLSTSRTSISTCLHIISSSSNTYQPHGGYLGSTFSHSCLSLSLLPNSSSFPSLPSSSFFLSSLLNLEIWHLYSLPRCGLSSPLPPSVAKECQHKVEARDAVSPLDDFVEASTCSKIFRGSERAPALDGVGFWALVHTLSKVRPNTRCHHRMSVAGLLVLSCCWFVPITRIFYQVMPEPETRANTQSLRHAQKVEFEMACGRR